MGLPPPAALAPGLTDHVCHAYAGEAELSDQARSFLAAGIDLGQRALVIAPTRELALAHEIAGAAALDRRAGASVDVLELSPIVGDRVLDVEGALRSMDAMLTSALERSFTGVRVVALLTHVATEPFLRQSLGAWEHVVGQWQSSRPVASACCFDRAALGDKAVQEVACLHPRVVTNGPTVPFRLYFQGGQLVLDGEVDSFSAPLLAHAVQHVRAVPGERPVIDARRLSFINHRGLSVLVDRLALRCGGVTLLGGPAIISRLRLSLGVGDEVLDVLPCPW
jgi:MEDS: MEthanogen/methylotroph, DcmR Sensory domain